MRSTIPLPLIFLLALGDARAEDEGAKSITTVTLRGPFPALAVWCQREQRPREAEAREGARIRVSCVDEAGPAETVGPTRLSSPAAPMRDVRLVLVHEAAVEKRARRADGIYRADSIYLAIRLDRGWFVSRGPLAAAVTFDAHVGALAVLDLAQLDGTPRGAPEVAVRIRTTSRSRDPAGGRREVGTVHVAGIGRSGPRVAPPLVLVDRETTRDRGKRVFVSDVKFLRGVAIASVKEGAPLYPRELSYAVTGRYRIVLR